MVQVCFCFGSGVDGKLVRLWAEPQPFHLWKDEPHPVALLAATAKFCADRLKDRILRLHKSIKIKRVGQVGAQSHLVNRKPDSGGYAFAPTRATSDTHSTNMMTPCGCFQTALSASIALSAGKHATLSSPSDVRNLHSDLLDPREWVTTTALQKGPS
jgi:hypothetical protein